MLISRDYAVQFTAALKTRVDIGKWKKTWHCFAIQPTSAGGYLSVPLFALYCCHDTDEYPHQRGQCH